MTSNSAQLANALSVWPLDREQKSLLKDATAEINEDQANALLDLLRGAESAVTSCANFLIGEMQSEQRPRSKQRVAREEGLRTGGLKFRPLHDRVVVRRIAAQEMTLGRIIIPDTAKEKPIEGEVVAVGPGGRDEAGKIVELHIKAGDRVLFSKWSGTEVVIGGAELLIMKESDILGVIESPAEVRRRTVKGAA
jgi:chaperonin GroES